MTFAEFDAKAALNAYLAHPLARIHQLAPRRALDAQQLLRRLVSDLAPASYLAAYMIATASWETGLTFRPETERGSDQYLVDRYWGNPRIRRELWVASPDEAIRYRGRGYVQTSLPRNYLREMAEANGVVWHEDRGVMMRRLGLEPTAYAADPNGVAPPAPDLDFWRSPDLLLVQDNAYRALVRGMMSGRITGVSLGRYLNETKRNWIDARRVVNGVDHAVEIAHDAEAWFVAIESATKKGVEA